MWSLAGSTARIRLDSFTAVVDLRYPVHGLQEVGWAATGAGIADVPICGLLGVWLAKEDGSPRDVVESYVRGVDLVATYAPLATGDLRPQIYWRVIRSSDPPGVGVEVIVSIETNLLDSDPAGGATSLVSADSILSLGESGQFRPLDLDRNAAWDAQPPEDAGALLFRLVGGRCSYLEMAHPLDFCEASLSGEVGQPPRARSRFSLFRERLERGVIRRCRLRGLLLPPAQDTPAAVALYREFSASPLPLTA
jgi:hypothetical protein